MAARAGAAAWEGADAGLHAQGSGAWAWAKTRAMAVAVAEALAGTSALALTLGLTTCWLATLRAGRAYAKYKGGGEFFEG